MASQPTDFRTVDLNLQMVFDVVMAERWSPAGRAHYPFGFSCRIAAVSACFELQ